MITSFIINNINVIKLSKQTIYYDSSNTVIDDIIIKGENIQIEFIYKHIYKVKEKDAVGARLTIQGTIIAQEPEDVRKDAEQSWIGKKSTNNFMKNIFDLINTETKPRMILLSYAMEIPVPLKLANFNVQAHDYDPKSQK